MNIDNINNLIEKLNHVKHTLTGGFDHFNMLTYAYSCGAPSCIAGWAAHLAGAESINPMTARDAGAEYIGIDREWALALLFEPPFETYRDITPAEAQYALAQIASHPNDYQYLDTQDLWPNKVEREREQDED